VVVVRIGWGCSMAIPTSWTSSCACRIWRCDSQTTKDDTDAEEDVDARRGA
jgi:hypothetical protein